MTDEGKWAAAHKNLPHLDADAALDTVCPGVPREDITSNSGPMRTCIVEGHPLNHALNIVFQKYGTFCPNSQKHIEEGDLLIDVTPFRTEEHGMPRLPEPGYFCQLTTMPRKNVYSATDDASSQGVIVIIVAALGISFAFIALGSVLAHARRSSMQIFHNKYVECQERVHQSMADLEVLIHPMSDEPDSRISTRLR